MYIVLEITLLNELRLTPHIPKCPDITNSVQSSRLAAFLHLSEGLYWGHRGPIQGLIQSARLHRLRLIPFDVWVPVASGCTKQHGAALCGCQLKLRWVLAFSYTGNETQHLLVNVYKEAFSVVWHLLHGMTFETSLYKSLATQNIQRAPLRPNLVVTLPLLTTLLSGLHLRYSVGLMLLDLLQ